MTVQVFKLAYLIMESDPSQRLEFQIFPDEIDSSVAATYANVAIIGRSEPYRIYQYTSAKVLKFDLQFIASVDQGDNGNPVPSVLRKIDFLESLCYPDSINQITIPPPVVRLIIGDTINERGIITRVDTRYPGPWISTFDDPNFVGPINLKDGQGSILPIQAITSIEFESVNVIPKLSKEVRSRTL